ncbi:hypothetical protein [Streptomyces sp. NPDC058701]|uniref:hypothetical protein n=1 Tax=Streptomyces sp. NPDC058701 TaxID=3346608 RepID=UPI00365DD398
MHENSIDQAAGSWWRKLTDRGRVAVVAFGAFSLIAAAGPAIAGVSNPSSAEASAAAVSCTPRERADALSAEEARVTQLLAGHTTLLNQADVDSLAHVGAQPGGITYAIKPHEFASVGGMGLTFLNPNPGYTPGLPTLLFYRPAPGATPAELLDPAHKDFPYELAGWGYAGQYNPGVAPGFSQDRALHCLKPTDWFVHERSAHPGDTWQNIPVPPAEAPGHHGDAPGSTPPSAQECGCLLDMDNGVGMAHPRMWDIHFWLQPDNPSAGPAVSILNPGTPIPGFDPGVGTGFFYPEGAVTSSAASKDMNHSMHSGHQSQ